MLSPQEIIGQKIWISLPRDPDFLDYGDVEAQRIKAEVTQPTSPPWFFARYIDPPRSVSATGQWMSLYEAQLAVLQDPVIEEEDLCEDELNYS